MIKLFLLISLFSNLTNADEIYSLGNSIIGTVTGTFSPQKKRLSQFELADTAYLTSLNIWLEPGLSAQKLRGIVYTDLNGKPDTLIHQTIDITLEVGGKKGWYYIPITTIKNLSPGKYWLGVSSDSSTNVGYYRSSSFGTRVIAKDDFSIVEPLSFGLADTTMVGYLSIYATYKLSVSCPCPAGTCSYITWLQPIIPGSTIVSYKLKYGTIPGQYITAIPTTQTSYQVMGLTPNTNYCFAVSAIDTNNNESPNSSETCIVTGGL